MAARPVIVGAGIAGLAAAWELVQRGLQPLVLEASPRAGGVILTEHIGGFVIDAGPDALLVQKPAGIALARELGLGDRVFPTLTPRTAYIQRHGRLAPIPEASVLGIPTRFAPFARSPLFSWRAKIRMAAELFVPVRRDPGDESIGSFMRRRFGDEAVTYLAEPLLAGIHAGDVERLSIQSLFPRLADTERQRGSLLRAFAAPGPEPTASQGAFVSFPAGMGELVDALTSRLPAGTIRYGAAVARIERATPFAITLADGEEIAAAHVIVAAPAWAAATMLDAVDRELAGLCGAIDYASTAIVAFGLRRDQVGHPLNGSGFIVPRIERRHVMAVTWVSSKWPQRAPAGHVLIRAFLGGATDPSALDRTDAALSHAALEELVSALCISGDPGVTRVYRWPRASAQHEVGHRDRLARIDARLARVPGLFLTGSGFRGTGIPDCVADARATAARASAGLQ